MAQLQYKQNRIRIAARKELLEQNRLRNGFERKLVRQLQSGFKATGRLARKEYEQLGRLVETSRQSERKLRDVLESHYRAVIDAFGTRVLRNRKQDSQFEILIREYMNTVGGTRITQINNTTMKAINKVISKGAVEGLGVQAIGKNIFEKMDGSFSKLRSQTISRTETHSAASYANDRVNASLGIPNQIKRWVSVADARTRSWHVALNGTEVGKDEPFTVTVKGISYKMDYTGDPKGGAVNTINCRCVTLYLDPDDVIVDDTTEVIDKTPPINADGMPDPLVLLKDFNTVALTKVKLNSIKQYSKKEALDIMGDKVAESAEDLRWVRRGNQGMASRYSKPYGADEMFGKVMDEGGARSFNSETASVMVQIQKEIDTLAELFNVPKVRSIVSVRKRDRAAARMGDGVLYLKHSYLKTMLTRTEMKPNTWTRGDDPKRKAYVLEAYLPDKADKMRALAYHEFAHLVHQQTGVKNIEDLLNPPVEKEMKTILKPKTRKEGSPTKYGESENVEWFAENFSAYFNNRKDLVDPKFTTLIERLVADAREGT
tara:strand:+ start:21 stop:1655 length:1635 start_codon:yes stop_codon:yes gene_type:complete